jgi:pilus assembly protein Flp/PilA
VILSRAAHIKRRAALVARHFSRDASAATAIEYGLIASLVSIMIMTGLLLVGDEVRALFESVRDQIVAVI